MADVALVCGGGGALGSAIVEALLERGDRVVAVDRHATTAPPSTGSREAVDLTSAEEVAALWERLEADGRHAALGRERGRRLPGGDGRRLGARTRCGFVERPESRHRLVVVPRGGAAAAGGRGDRERLLAPAVAGGAGAAAYSVAKAGVVRLTEVLAAELAERRVRVNAILPSVIDTPANRATMTRRGSSGTRSPRPTSPRSSASC